MTIRPAAASDAKALESLERELFTRENYPLSRRAFYYHIRNSLLLVALDDDGALAGYALALVRRRHPKLYSLGVHPAFRGRGVATGLMGRLMYELAKRGFERCALEVRCDNARAIALYEGLGFRVVKTLRGFYRDGCDAYWMEADHANETLSETV